MALDDSLWIDVVTKEGTKLVNIGATALSAFGFAYQDRVQTPLGHAQVLGVDSSNRVWFLVDGDSAASYWSSCRTAADFAARGIVVLGGGDGGASSVGAGGARQASMLIDTKDYHGLKRVSVLSADRYIVMQSSNGPCPVIALANALSLRGQLPALAQVAERSDTITAQNLRQAVLEFIVSRSDDQVASLGPSMTFCPSQRQEGTLAAMVNAEGFLAALRDELRANGESILARFYDGLNVSPTFDVVDGFAAEKDAALFALAACRVVHGWLMQDEPGDELRAAARVKNYDELIVATFDDSDAATAAIAREFLDAYPTQVTPHGIQSLCDTLADREVAVMFQNNHFGTLQKIGGKVLRVVTDVAFADMRGIVFEGISVSGGGDFFDGDGLEIGHIAMKVFQQHRNKYTHRAILYAIDAVRLRCQSESAVTMEAVLAELNSV